MLLVYLVFELNSTKFLLLHFHIITFQHQWKYQMFEVEAKIRGYDFNHIQVLESTQSIALFIKTLVFPFIFQIENPDNDHCAIIQIPIYTFPK